MFKGDNRHIDLEKRKPKRLHGKRGKNQRVKDKDKSRLGMSVRIRMRVTAREKQQLDNRTRDDRTREREQLDNRTRDEGNKRVKEKESGRVTEQEIGGKRE